MFTPPTHTPTNASGADGARRVNEQREGSVEVREGDKQVECERRRGDRSETSVRFMKTFQ